MANMSDNNNTNIGAVLGGNENSYASTRPVAPPVNANGVVISTLRDVCNTLEQPPISERLLPGACSYDHIIGLLQRLDLQDDGIMMNQKIKAIEIDFCNIVQDENMLCESMEYMNDKALDDGETALKFALLFSSRNFDALAMKDTKVRSAMLNILETNFIAADTYRCQNKNRFYNSITMLGEYYHRVRLADNAPIRILGESLLGLLIREVSETDIINAKLAKLILSQITLNGDLLRSKHNEDCTQLLYYIRRKLIEPPKLTSVVIALLLMTLDLYYNNFKNLGKQLEEMYTQYLVQDTDDCEGNNNMCQQQLQPHPQQNQDLNNSAYKNNSADTNFDVSGAFDNLEIEPMKKWSEEVSLFESSNDSKINSSISYAGADKNSLNSSLTEQSDILTSSNEQESNFRNSRRSNKPSKSPRPLKQYNSSSDRTDPVQQFSGEEEQRDESKPLPRWRAPRFNRDPSDQQDPRQRSQFRPYSAGLANEDDSSARSENGIRLYSINDRLKHSQEKIERSNGNNFNSIANSNWDRQSQHDDRSERSYISNYERGNNYRRGGRHYNNRQTFDKPPRFQKNQPHNNPNQPHNNPNPHHDNPNPHHNISNPHHHQNKDHKIHSDSWRRSKGGSSQQDDNVSQRSNGPESNSRSSSRARTLPRPAKSNFDVGANPQSYRRDQSPNTHHRYQRQHNARYSSQSSLASESSNTFERRQNDRNRNFGRRPYHKDSHNNQNQPQQNRNWHQNRDAANVHEEQSDELWGTKPNNELILNARQTTKYMNYLSAKK